jgi:hypothetical protein
VIMTEDNGFDILEEVVAEAHKICNQILLFEAMDMEEDEVRLFLDCNAVTDHQMQERYIRLVRLYAENTVSRKSGEQEKGD